MGLRFASRARFLPLCAVGAQGLGVSCSEQVAETVTDSQCTSRAAGECLFCSVLMHVGMNLEQPGTKNVDEWADVSLVRAPAHPQTLMLDLFSSLTLGTACCRRGLRRRVPAVGLGYFT